MKLKYSNEWERDIYTVKGKVVTNLTEVKILDKTYQVTSQEISNSYSDHGHTYYGRSTHYFIEEEVFGITMKFDLNRIVEKVRITPVKYEVREDPVQ